MPFFQNHTHVSQAKKKNIYLQAASQYLPINFQR